MVEIMYMYVGLERGLQEIVKYSHCSLLIFHWPGLMHAPSGSLRFLLVSEVPFSAAYKLSESIA